MSRRTPSRIPKEVRPALGGIVLVASIRTIDVLWRLVTRRPTPITAAAPQEDEKHAERVGDRLVYAALLGAALRFARRAGLPKDAKAHTGTKDR